MLIIERNYSASLRLNAQLTDSSCGPASLAALATLLGRHLDEAALMEALGTRCWPIGTDNHQMENWAMKNLPVVSHGADNYRGGLAVANIRNPMTGGGHYVAVLGQRHGILRYFCPLLGKTVLVARDALNWAGGSGGTKKWSLNVAQQSDYFETPIGSATRSNWTQVRRQRIETH